MHVNNNQLTYDLDPGLSGEPRPARPHANAADVHAGMAMIGREQAERPVPQVVVAEGDRRALDRRPVLPTNYVSSSSSFIGQSTLISEGKFAGWMDPPPSARRSPTRAEAWRWRCT